MYRWIAINDKKKKNEWNVQTKSIKKVYEQKIHTKELPSFLEPSNDYCPLNTSLQKSQTIEFSNKSKSIIYHGYAIKGDPNNQKNDYEKVPNTQNFEQTAEEQSSKRKRSYSIDEIIYDDCVNIEVQEAVAIRDYEKALNLMVNSVPFSQKWQKARKIFKYLTSLKVLESSQLKIGPRVQYASLCNLCTLYEQEDNLSQALTLLLTATKISFSQVSLWKRIAILSQKCRLYHLAKFSFEQALRFNSVNGQESIFWICISGLLECTYSMGNDNLCLQIAEAAIKLDSEYFYGWLFQFLLKSQKSSLINETSLVTQSLSELFSNLNKDRSLHLESANLFILNESNNSQNEEYVLENISLKSLLKALIYIYNAQICCSSELKPIKLKCQHNSTIDSVDSTHIDNILDSDNLLNQNSSKKKIHIQSPKSIESVPTQSTNFSHSDSLKDSQTLEKNISKSTKRKSARNIAAKSSLDNKVLFRENCRLEYLYSHQFFLSMFGKY